MSKSYNLRSSGKKKELKCYIQRLSESNIPKGFSPEVRLERLKVLETPEQNNFRFYLEQDRIVRKQSKMSRNKKTLFLICFSVILFSLFLIYWQNELQICGFIFYTKIKKFQSNMKDYYFENIDPYVHSIEKYMSVLVQSQVKHEKLKKLSQEEKFVDVFKEVKVSDLVRTYMTPSRCDNMTPQMLFSFVKDQCKVDSVPALTEEFQMKKYKFYNSTYFESGNLTDYALASQGAKILRVFDTESYGIFTVPFLNYDLGPLLSNVLSENVNFFSTKGPASILIPWKKPGDCWAFKGSQGRVEIQLSQKVMVTAVTIDHIPKNLSPSGNVFSAPKKFSVFGIGDIDGETTRQYLGSYEYKVEGPPMQTFSVDFKTNTPISNVEFIIESNQGNKVYTCLYKIRVHGYT